MSRKLEWEVTIAGADNGYIVRVGCKLLVFESKESLIKEFTAYVNGENTELAEKLTAGQPTCETAQAPVPVPESLAGSVARG